MTSIYWLHALALLVIVACVETGVFIRRQKWEETKAWWDE